MDDLPKIVLARWRGVPVHLDVTFAVVPLALFPWRLFSDVLSLDWEHVLVTRRLGLWVIQVAAVFASILVHELAHAFVARRYHVATSAIQVGGFYGLAILQDSVVLRRWIVPILAAGPASNALIALGAWTLLGMPDIGHRLDPRIDGVGFMPPVWIAALIWIFQLNVGLAVFNLLPAFPLDGGRIARLALRRLASETRAVTVVSACGIAIAVWCMLAALAYGGSFAIIGFMLASLNYAIWRRELPAPED